MIEDETQKNKSQARIPLHSISLIPCLSVETIN